MVNCVIGNLDLNILRLDELRAQALAPDAPATLPEQLKAAEADVAAAAVETTRYVAGANLEVATGTEAFTALTRVSGAVSVSAASRSMPLRITLARPSISVA